MTVTLRDTFEPGLPPNDDHPYRSGVWRPQYREYDAWDMEIIGEIPEDLNGVYLRNTENPLFEPIKRYHPFDGDSMMHSISFENGEARYANRFVRTDAFLAEQDAKESLWAGIAEHPSSTIADYGWGARTFMKDNASTDVVVHGGVALASFYQCGELYRLDPRTLEKSGQDNLERLFPGRGCVCSPKLTNTPGSCCFSAISRMRPTCVTESLAARANSLLTWTSHYLDPVSHTTWPLRRIGRFSMIYLCSGVLRLSPGYYSNIFDRDLPSRFALVPRHGSTEEILWFEADPTFVLHWTNAYEDGDWVILDGFFQHNPTARGVDRGTGSHKGFETLDMNVLQARAHRWKFNIVTGECKEESMSETCAEFPMINGRHAGRRHRYSYNARCAPGLFAFDGLIKHDLDTGSEDLYEFEPGVFISETVMAPKEGAVTEDDGYLVTFSSDMNRDLSEALIFGAADPTEGTDMSNPAP